MLLKHYFYPTKFYSKKGKLNSLRTEAFFLISLIKNSIDLGGLDSSIEKEISKVFKLFTEIFGIINELSKIEIEYWGREMFDEEFYFTDLRREILGIIDMIIYHLDSQLIKITDAEHEMIAIDKPLENIRMSKLRTDMIHTKSKMESMRLRFQ